MQKRGGRERSKETYKPITVASFHLVLGTTAVGIEGEDGLYPDWPSICAAGQV